MPVLAALKKILDDEKISYEVYNHPTAFTAQQVVAAQHISGNAMAKVVMLMVDGKLVMAVTPASRKLDLEVVGYRLDAKDVRLAKETEFAGVFPNCEIGAMPPFGNLFDVPVYADAAFEGNESIYFNAGNHQQTVRLRYGDFKRLAKPRIIALSTKGKKKAA